MRDVGAVILVGGKSSRMGSNKALLKIHGNTFLDRIIKQLSSFDELLMSVDKSEKYIEYNIQKVEDEYTQIGPIGGLYSALVACSSKQLLAVSCDMPFFSAAAADYMCGYSSDSYDVFPIETRTGRIQPLCAIYSKKAIPILREQIENGNYRMYDAMRQLRVKPIPLKHSIFADDIVQNINNMDEYNKVLNQIRKPTIIAVSGIKNSGKTTMIEAIVKRLKREGLYIAVIKHDGHDFSPDVPGTDSYRISKAGAKGVSVFSNNRYFITKEQSSSTVEGLSCFFKDADLILLEGGKYSAYPKIEIIRSEINNKSVCDATTLLAICSNTDINLSGTPILALDDYDGVIRIILKYLQRQANI